MEINENPQWDYGKKYVLFFNIGLVMSLLFVISAFEWEVAEYISDVDPKAGSFDLPMVSPPITVIEPPRPKVQVFNLKPEEDKIEIEEPEFVLEIVTGEPEVTEIPADLFEQPDEKPDVIEDFAEEMPYFDGGLQAFYKFVGSNLKYPSQARKLGIEGKVFVQFVVDKDGSLSDIRVVRGIGGGCDEEVLRIIGMCPPWHAGRQQKIPVRVRMMMPVTFKLQ